MNTKEKQLTEFIGREVQRTRKAKGFSRKFVATQLGITYQQYSKNEKGQNRISAARLFQISIILDEDINYFYGTMA